LFEAIDAALHHIAPSVDDRIEDERTACSRRPLRPLVASLGEGVLDLPLSQQAPTARIAVALVGNEAVGARAWPPASTSAWNPDALQDGDQLGTVMTLSRGNYNGERPSLAVTGKMELGGQPSTAASEPFVAWVLDPFFSSARLRRRRAPLAC